MAFKLRYQNKGKNPIMSRIGKTKIDGEWQYKPSIIKQTVDPNEKVVVTTNEPDIDIEKTLKEFDTKRTDDQTYKVWLKDRGLKDSKENKVTYNTDAQKWRDSMQIKANELKGSVLHNNGNNDNDKYRSSNLRTDKWNPEVVTTGEWKPGGDGKEVRNITTTQTGTGTTVIPGQKDTYSGEGGYMSDKEWNDFLKTPAGIAYIKKTQGQKIIEPLSKENVQTETRVIPTDETTDDVSSDYNMRVTPKIRKVVTDKPSLFGTGTQQLTYENIAIGDVDMLDPNYSQYYDRGVEGGKTSNYWRSAGDRVYLQRSDVPTGRSQSHELRSHFGRGKETFFNLFRKNKKNPKIKTTVMGTGPHLSSGGTKYINPDTLSGNPIKLRNKGLPRAYGSIRQKLTK